MSENKSPNGLKTGTHNDLGSDYAEKCTIFGRNVRLARKEMGFTTVAAAGFLGISPAYLGLIERGERTPSVETLFKICDFFEKSIDSMLIHTDIKPSKALEASQLESKTARKQMVAFRMIKTLDINELDYLVNVMKGIKTLEQKKADANAGI